MGSAEENHTDLVHQEFSLRKRKAVNYDVRWPVDTLGRVRPVVKQTNRLENKAKEEKDKAEDLVDKCSNSSQKSWKDHTLILEDKKFYESDSGPTKHDSESSQKPVVAADLEDSRAKRRFTGIIQPKMKNDVTISMDTSNMCAYQCSECHRVYSLEGYFAHVTAAGQLLQSQVMTAGRRNKCTKGRYRLIREVYHRCLICDEFYLFTVQHAANHCRHKHGIKYKDYARLYLNKKAVISFHPETIIEDGTEHVGDKPDPALSSSSFSTVSSSVLAPSSTSCVPSSLNPSVAYSSSASFTLLSSSSCSATSSPLIVFSSSSSSSTGTSSSAGVYSVVSSPTSSVTSSPYPSHSVVSCFASGAAYSSAVSTHSSSLIIDSRNCKPAASPARYAPQTCSNSFQDGQIHSDVSESGRDVRDVRAISFATDAQHRYAPNSSQNSARTGSAYSEAVSAAESTVAKSTRSSVDSSIDLAGRKASQKSDLKKKYLNRERKSTSSHNICAFRGSAAPPKIFSEVREKVVSLPAPVPAQDNLSFSSSLVLQQKETIVADWCDRTVFRCRQCSYATRKVRQMEAHVGAKHGARGRKFPASFTASQVFLGCRICRELVCQERSALEFHIRNLHGLSLDSYHQQFILPASKLR